MSRMLSMPATGGSNLVWQDERFRESVFVVFSGPSGGGKTTTSSLVSKVISGSTVLVKHTNRARRVGELDGVDYHFVGDCWFDNVVSSAGLLAYEDYYGNRYGLSKAEAELHIPSSRLGVVILNPQLALLFRELYVNSVLFFVAPQPLEVLRDRLSKRGNSSTEVAVRSQYLEAEIEAARKLDCFVNTSEPLQTQVKTILRTIGDRCPFLYVDSR